MADSIQKRNEQSGNSAAYILLPPPVRVNWTASLCSEVVCFYRCFVWIASSGEINARWARKSSSIECFKTTCIENRALGPHHESFPGKTYYLNQAIARLSVFAIKNNFERHHDFQDTYCLLLLSQRTLNHKFEGRETEELSFTHKHGFISLWKAFPCEVKYLLCFSCVWGQFSVYLTWYTSLTLQCSVCPYNVVFVKQ